MEAERDPVDTHIAKRLRLARILCGQSQTELGQALGVTFQQVQKYEKATNRLAASTLFRAAHAVRQEVPYFFDGLQAVIVDHGSAVEAADAAAADLREFVAAFTALRTERDRAAVLGLCAALSR